MANLKKKCILFSKYHVRNIAWVRDR